MIGLSGFMQAPKADRPKSIFQLAKEGAIGQQVRCPACGRPFRKKTKAHTFCSNGRSRPKGNSNCKDDFWNRMDPNKSREARRERLGLDPYELDLDDDQSWDAHKDR